MKKTIFTAILLIMFLFCFCGCENKKKAEKEIEKQIENYTIDAEYAVSHSNYEDARTAYNNILSLDSENRTAIYGLKDLEEAERKHDSNILSDIHSAVCEAMRDYTVATDKSYNVPRPGDYSLEDFISNAGSSFANYVFDERLHVSNSAALQEQFISCNKDGIKLSDSSQCELRIAYYSSAQDTGLVVCIYITNSYDSYDTLLTCGALYNPDYEFSVSNMDPTMIGVHSHTFLVEKNGKKLGAPDEGDIYYFDEYNGSSGKGFKTPLNTSQRFEVISHDPLPINYMELGGLVLKDEYSNYYVEIGMVNDGGYELVCIPKEVAMDNLYCMDSKLTRIRRW